MDAQEAFCAASRLVEVLGSGAALRLDVGDGEVVVWSAARLALDDG